MEAQSQGYIYNTIVREGGGVSDGEKRKKGKEKNESQGGGGGSKCTIYTPARSIRQN